MGSWGAFDVGLRNASGIYIVDLGLSNSGFLYDA